MAYMNNIYCNLVTLTLALFFNNYCLNCQSVPGVGGDKEEDSGLTREEQQEQERLRWDGMGGRDMLDYRLNRKNYYSSEIV